MRLASVSNRRGFTLIEVLVAAGLCMLIMAVVTQAFQRGMDTLSQLKSVGELQQRLRTFETAVRSDLEAEHFESKYGPKVSDQRLDLLANASLTNDTTPWRPPSRGFFRIVNDEPIVPPGQRSVIFEGTDNDGNVSTRAIDHMLHMTIRRDGSRGDKMFSTPIPPVAMSSMASMSLTQMNTTANTFSSEWAEVVYFLDVSNPIGNTGGGTPLYGLYRRLRILAGAGNPGSVAMQSMMSTASTVDLEKYQGMSNTPTAMTSTRPVNGPTEVRNPRSRLGGLHSDRTRTLGTGHVNADCDCIARETTINGSGNISDATKTTGGDLLLADVISFEIKANWDPLEGAAGAVYPATVPGMAASYEFPFNVLPAVTNRNTALVNRRVYDTWYDTPNENWLGGSTATNKDDMVPNPIRLRALQIKVRVWDRKNNMARQVTIVQNI